MPGLPDPSQWVRDLFPQAVAALLSALTFGLSDLVRQVLLPQSPFNFVARTPPGLSYDSPTVMTLWEATRTIANAALAAVVVWGGFNAMARPYFGSTYHDVMELVPRVLLGAVLANTSRDWCRLAIDFNNAFSDAIGNVTPPGFDQAPRPSCRSCRSTSTGVRPPRAGCGACSQSALPSGERSPSADSTSARPSSNPVSLSVGATNWNARYR